MASKTDYEDLVVGVAPLTLDDVEKLVPVVYEKNAFKNAGDLPSGSFAVKKDASPADIFGQELEFNAKYCRLVDMKGLHVSEETGGIGESTSSSAERAIDGLDASKVAFGTSSTIVSTEAGKDADFIAIMQSNSRIRLTKKGFVAQSIFYDAQGTIVARGRSVQQEDKKIGQEGLINFADVALPTFTMTKATMSLPNNQVKLPNTPLLAGPQLRSLGIPSPDPIADAFTIVADNDTTNPTDFSVCSPTLVGVSENHGSPILTWLSHGHLILWDHRRASKKPSSKRNINAIKARLALNLYLTKNEYRYQTAISKSRVDGLFDGERKVEDGEVIFKSDARMAFETRKGELLGEIKRVAFAIKTKLKLLGYKISKRKARKYKTLTLNEQNLLLEALSGEKIGAKHYAVFLRHPNHLMALEYTLRQRAKRIIQNKNRASEAKDEQAVKITESYLLDKDTKEKLLAMLPNLNSLDNMWLKVEEVDDSKDAYDKAQLKSEKEAEAKLRNRSTSTEEKTEDEKKKKKDKQAKKTGPNASMSTDEQSIDQSVIGRVLKKVVAKASSPKKEDAGVVKRIKDNTQKVKKAQAQNNPEKVQETVQAIAKETQGIVEKAVETKATELLNSPEAAPPSLPPPPPKRRIEFTRIDDGAPIPTNLIKSDMEKATNTWLKYLKTLTDNEGDIDPEVASAYTTADAQIEKPTVDMLKVALVALIRNLPHYLAVNQRNLAESLKARSSSPLVLAAIVSKRIACYQTVIQTIEATSLSTVSAVEAEVLATLFATLIPESAVKGQLDIVNALTPFLVRPEGPDWVFTELPVDADFDSARFYENAAYLKSLTQRIQTIKDAVLEALSRKAKKAKIDVDVSSVSDSLLLWAALVPYDPDLSVGSLKDRYGKATVNINNGEVKIEVGGNLESMVEAINNELKHRVELQESEAFKQVNDLIAKAKQSSINNINILDFEGEADADAEDPMAVIKRLKQEELLLAAALLPHKDEKLEEKKAYLLQPLIDKIKIAILLSASGIAVAEMAGDDTDDNSSVVCTYENVVALYERNSDARLAATRFAEKILEYHKDDGGNAVKSEFKAEDINQLMLRGKTIRRTFIDEESASPDEILEDEALLEAAEDDDDEEAEEDEKDVLTLDNAAKVEIDLEEEVKRGAGAAALLNELYTTLKSKIKPSVASQGLLEQIEDALAEIKEAKNVLTFKIVERQAYIMAEIVKREKAKDVEPKNALDESLKELDTSSLEDNMAEEGEPQAPSGKRQRGGFARQFYTIVYKNMIDKLDKLDPKSPLIREIEAEIERLDKADNAMTKLTVQNSTELFSKYIKTRQGRTEKESVDEISVDPSVDEDASDDESDDDASDDEKDKKEDEEKRAKERERMAKEAEEKRKQRDREELKEYLEQKAEEDRKAREAEEEKRRLRKEKDLANAKAGKAEEKPLLGDSDDELFEDDAPLNLARPGQKPDKNDRKPSIFDSYSDSDNDDYDDFYDDDPSAVDDRFTARDPSNDPGDNGRTEVVLSPPPPNTVDEKGFSIYNISKPFYEAYGNAGTLPKESRIQIKRRIFDIIDSKKPGNIELTFRDTEGRIKLILRTTLATLYFEGVKDANEPIGIYRRVYNFGYDGAKGNLPFPRDPSFQVSDDKGKSFHTLSKFPKIPAEGTVVAVLNRGTGNNAQIIKLSKTFALEMDNKLTIAILDFKGLGGEQLSGGQLVLSLRGDLEVVGDEIIVDGMSMLFYEKL